MNKLIIALSLCLLALPASAQPPAVNPSAEATNQQAQGGESTSRPSSNGSSVEAATHISSIPSVEEFILDIDRDATLDDASLQQAKSTAASESLGSVKPKKLNLLEKLNSTVNNVVVFGLATGVSLRNSLEDLGTSLQNNGH